MDKAAEIAGAGVAWAAHRRGGRFAATGVAAAALVVGLAACSGAPATSTPPPPAATATVPPATGGPQPTIPAAQPGGGTAEVPAQDRQVRLRDPDGLLLTIGPDGILTTTPDESSATPFVFVPHAPGSDVYLLRTGPAGASGEPDCLAATGRGEDPGGGVAAAACDTSLPTQSFSVFPGPEGIALGVGRGQLWVDNILVSVQLDYPGTPFTAVDAGPAPAGPGS